MFFGLAINIVNLNNISRKYPANVTGSHMETVNL